MNIRLYSTLNVEQNGDHIYNFTNEKQNRKSNPPQKIMPILPENKCESDMHFNNEKKITLDKITINNIKLNIIK